MKLKLKLLFGALLHKKLRLLLSLIGIIIGVSALLIMNSFGESAKVKTLAEIETFGPDLFMVISGSARVMAGRAMQTEQMTTLKVEDAQAIRNLPGVKNISPVYTGQTVVRGEGVNLITTVNGVNEEYVAMRNYPLLEGRNFSREEIQTLSKVVILGYKIKNQDFGD
jgi:ABC-type antimicrobial peptide transport system permease subunit